MLIWRGLGILVVLIPFLFGLLVQFLVDKIWDVGTFAAHPTIAATILLISGAIIFFLGRHVNRRIPPSDGNPFGREKGDDQHSLFLIPMEYWSVLLALVAISDLKRAFS